MVSPQDTYEAGPNGNEVLGPNPGTNILTTNHIVGKDNIRWKGYTACRENLAPWYTANQCELGGSLVGFWAGGLGVAPKEQSKFKRGSQKSTPPGRKPPGPKPLVEALKGIGWRKIWDYLWVCLFKDLPSNKQPFFEMVSSSLHEKHKNRWTCLHSLGP